MGPDEQRSSESTPGRSRWPGAASTPSSATSPRDYALLEGAFGVGLGCLIALNRSREADGAPALPDRELPLLALATFALSDVVAKEKISTWLREPFVEEGGDHKPVAPEGTGLRHTIGELLTCTRCMGTWSALALVMLRTGWPSGGRLVVRVLALTGVNDFMQGAFRVLGKKANQAAPPSAMSDST